jgi:hypothetical protein
MALRPDRFGQQQALQANPTARIQPSAARWKPQRLDHRAQKRLAQGIGFQQPLHGSFSICHFSAFLFLLLFYRD